MAYDHDKIKKQAIKVAKEKDLVFMEDVISFLPCGRSTFYDNKLHKSDKLEEVLFNNKISQKRELRKNWLGAKNATLQLALYKLLANQEELKRLNNNMDESKLDEINDKLSKVIPNYFE